MTIFNKIFFYFRRGRTLTTTEEASQVSLQTSTSQSTASQSAASHTSAESSADLVESHNKESSKKKSKVEPEVERLARIKSKIISDVNEINSKALVDCPIRITADHVKLSLTDDGVLVASVQCLLCSMGLTKEVKLHASKYSVDANNYKTHVSRVHVEKADKVQFLEKGAKMKKANTSVSVFFKPAATKNSSDPGTSEVDLTASSQDELTESTVADDKSKQ